MTKSPARNFCCTFWKKPTELPKGVRYAIHGEEICPESKKIHWQSYIELHKPMRYSQIKKLYNDDTVHIENRRGTREEAKNYCMKDNKFYELGTWIKGQGHRTDIDNFVTKLKNGEKLSDMMIEEPSIYCRYRNGLKDISAELTKKKVPEWRDVEVTVITGNTGIGKTRKAIEENPGYYKIEGWSLEWWQDYDGEKTIIIDEYDNDINITKLLNLLDGYKLRLPIKGSHTYANWNKVIITTNLKIEQIHPKAKETHRNALFRRIDKIINLWPECNEVPQGNTDIVVP